MRIVLLADKRPERETMVRVLQQAGCVVEPCADAKGAVAAIAREAPQVIVAAVPGSGGPDLIRLLRGADGSGHAYLLAVLDRTPGGRETSAAIAAGAQDVLHRPVVDAELVERAHAPKRLLKWAHSVAKPAAFDFSRALDVARLNVWQTLGCIVADDLAQMMGLAVQTSAGWPRRFGRTARAATIPMSLASEQIELRISIAIDEQTAKWLGATLLGNPAAGKAEIDDVLRELANTAGGAVKRAALPENVTLTTGLPVNATGIRSEGDGVQTYAVLVDGGKAVMAIVGEIARRGNERVAASRLCEGMVLVHDLRSDSGALLMTAGSRLTSTSAARLAQVLGPQFMIEVACAA